MYDYILDAWTHHAPRLATLSPRQFQPRLDRRRRLAYVPRACCLAIRASDHRLPPPDPADPVVLDRADTARLCAPVKFPAPRLTIDHATRLLGVSRAGLLPARVNGVFSTDHVEGLGAYWGLPRPLLTSYDLLDPASRGLLPLDPLSAAMIDTLVARLPDDFPPQRLCRVERVHDRTARYRIETENLHPEHPAVDPPPRKRKSLKLPKPPPDPTPYLWKGDVFMGYNWRNPMAQARYEREQAAKAHRREYWKRRRREHPAPSRGGGSLQHRGWNWLCPRCGKAVRVLYLPTPPLSLVDHTPREILRKFPTLAHEIDRAALPARIDGFACDRCHGVRRFSGCDPNAWNEFVTYLSGGLLFGREVPRPPCCPRISRKDAPPHSRKGCFGKRSGCY